MSVTLGIGVRISAMTPISVAIVRLLRFYGLTMFIFNIDGDMLIQSDLLIIL